MLTVYRGLSPIEEEKLIEFMDFYQRFQTTILDKGPNKISMFEPEEP